MGDDEALRARAMAAVSEALVGAATDLSLDAVLERLVCAARNLVGAKYAAGSVHHVRVSRVAPFGAFVELEPGVEALMPAAETGLDRGADLKRAIPIGSEFDVVVLDVDAAARKIRVSKQAVATQREQAEVREYTEKADAAAPASIGSMADKLRDALKGR